MYFLESNFSVRILSVQNLKWQSNNTYVQPRPYNAISFRIKGNSDFSDKETNSHLNDGDILFMPQNVGYHLKSQEEEIIVVHFELDGPLQKHFEVITPGSPDAYKQIFESLLNEWDNREPGYYLKTMSRFYTLLAQLQKHFSLADNIAYVKIKKSVEYLHKNFTDPALTIDTLCTISNVSDTYFRKLFFKLYQTTPVKYINTLRINYAVELLETGYYSIEQIAGKCGFEDPKYFCTVFKKYKRNPPSFYKIDAK